MNDFDYDAYLKKVTARSASKRVGNGKGCKLPSDYLTPAQKKKLSGAVKTLNLNQPITWAEFTALDKPLQATYINHIIENYHVGLALISVMMGREKTDLSNYVKSHSIRVKKAKGPSSKEARDNFWAVYGIETAEREIQPEIETRAVEVMENKTSVTRYEFNFRNVTDWEEVLKLMGNMPLPENACISIFVRQEAKNESKS